MYPLTYTNYDSKSSFYLTVYERRVCRHTLCLGGCGWPRGSTAESACVGGRRDCSLGCSPRERSRHGKSYLLHASSPALSRPDTLTYR